MNPQNDAQQTHNYQTKLQRMMAAGLIPSYIGIHDVDVYHDDWCAIHAGGYCNCDPDIQVRPGVDLGRRN